MSQFMSMTFVMTCIRAVDCYFAPRAMTDLLRKSSDPRLRLIRFKTDSAAVHAKFREVPSHFFSAAKKPGFPQGIESINLVQGTITSSPARRKACVADGFAGYDDIAED
ncbi:hypothetical protein EJ08DRAFT_653347 [Tothia fuscella]|uniref:Uncharacterized protein n=1 Tax=Tothia fuscella TaxID=1048955 RepID=A0A9P4NH96_9PEZI|nr:hypothetical protein EJ08DRAFT_653347 [Tothia fuscella]